MPQEAQALRDAPGMVSARAGPLSKLAIAKLVWDLRISAVPQGSRSSFQDWAAECSEAPREVCALALAHVYANAIEAPDQRTALFDWLVGQVRALAHDYATPAATGGKPSMSSVDCT